jgi:hypothetical protein
MRPPDELLYDSEASLRLVDHAIEELNDAGVELDDEKRGFLEHVVAQPGGLNELSRTLLRAYAETVGVVQRIRQSCGMLDKEGLDRLEQMRGRLREISNATETATTDILDTVTRAIAMVERLDGSNAADRDKLVTSLKEELNGVSQHLQFQDITAQQLGHLASLIADMRHRITHVVTMFAQPDAAPEPAGGVYDPNASTAPSAEGQAVADEIFAVRVSRKSA